MTTKRMELDHITGKVDSASDVVKILSTTYSNHTAYALAGDNCIRAYLRLHLVLKMQDDGLLSREEFTPIATRWVTAKNTDYAALFEMPDMDTWQLHVFSKTPEGLDQINQILNKADLL